MASFWLQIQAVYERVRSRKSLYTALAPFTAPTVCTLHLDVVRKARVHRVPHSGPGAALAEAAGDRGDGGEEAKDSGAGAGAGGDGEGAVRLTLESYPEISQLPLEYQVGWTWNSCVSAWPVWAAAGDLRSGIITRLC